ncbi:hypothetical protein FRB95_003799 [Tulasnella sp. JGI-2019a]|nr:hypothetical protein FRB95_003799 [Tulasnella sp. JGI-2019a]
MSVSVGNKGVESDENEPKCNADELLRSEPYPATNSRWLPAAESSNVFIQSGVTLHNREGSGKDLAAVVDMDSDEEAPPPRKKRIIPAQQPEKPTNSLREHTSSALSTRLLEEQREAAIKLWTERFRHTPPTSRKQIAEQLGISLDLVDLVVQERKLETEFRRLSGKEQDSLQGAIVAAWNQLDQHRRRPTLKQIAVSVGVSPFVVSKILSRNQIRISTKRIRPTDDEAAKICEEWSVVWTDQRTFAKRHGISTNTLRSIFRDCGLLPPKSAASRDINIVQ